jgi:hypothetical protein
MYMTSGFGFSVTAPHAVNLTIHNSLVLDHAYVFKVRTFTFTFIIVLTSRKDPSLRLGPYESEVLTSFIVDTLSREVGKPDGLSSIWKKYPVLHEGEASIVFMAFGATVVSFFTE